ncbi:MAG: J domain-containing protein [Actinomycetota bacterium]
MADYYEVLGIPRDATDQQIKKAYRDLARRHHPDANPGQSDAGADPSSTNRFKEVAEAYSVLSDAEKRRSYDTFGPAGPTGPSGGFDAFDIFSSFFGGDSFRSDRTVAQRGSDRAVAVTMSLEEVVKGRVATVNVARLGDCNTCSGSGARPGTYASTCGQCGGTGAVRRVQRSFLGNVMTASTCPQCRGAGEEISSPCDECRGVGRLAVEDTIEVEIPAGVEDGMQIRKRGFGDTGVRGGGAGDLFVQLRVLAEQGVERHEDDLIKILPVAFTKAVLGAVVEVETFDGIEELRIAPGTSSGKILRLKGHGIPHLHGVGRGDFLFETVVEVPTRLSPEEEELLRRFAEMRGEQVADVGDDTIMGKIKSAFRS